MLLPFLEYYNSLYQTTIAIYMAQQPDSCYTITWCYISLLRYCNPLYQITIAIWYSNQTTLLHKRCYINICIVARILQLFVANYCVAALAIQCVSNYSFLVRLPRDQSLTIKFCTAPIGNAFICNCDHNHSIQYYCNDIAMRQIATTITVCNNIAMW